MTVFEIAERVVDFVVRDPRFRQLSLRGSIATVFREAEGVEPTPAQTAEVSRMFWMELDRRNPNIHEPHAPVGGGSPTYILEDLSPWQENAIRALEERSDA
jgi:hypothetical protein